MSLDYAAALSKYPDKGRLGETEFSESAEKLTSKISLLAEAMRRAHHIVFITGAGVSTSCGIPDFRGPNGVWTLEEKGIKPEFNIDFTHAKPSFTHFAINSIFNSGKDGYVVSQNVDNLHLKSGLSKDRLSEVHGNVFTEKCLMCGREYWRGSPTKTIGLRPTGNVCGTVKVNGRKCRGRLVDTVLDWEDNLPFDELAESEYQCSVTELCVVLGTSMQIQPTGNMPFKTKRYGGKIMIVNLQKTRLDNHADLVIHSKCDEVLERVTSLLGVKVECECKTMLNVDEWVVIKESFRPDPPKVMKHQTKRIKICKDNDSDGRKDVKVKSEIKKE